MLDHPPLDAPLREGTEGLEQVLDRFELAWQAGAAPAIEEFLPPALTGERTADAAGRRELLEELIKVDLEYRWRRHGHGKLALDVDSRRPVRGQLPPAPRLEDYVERLPGMGLLAELSVELVGEEYRARQQWGDRPGHPKYLLRFPQQAAALRVVLARIDGELAAEPARAKRAPKGVDTPQTQSQSLGVHLRCPHCLQLMEVVAALPSRILACPSCGGAFSVESLVTGPGRAVQAPALRLGRYEMRELLGTGAFGSVWRARDTELAREVAIKLPRSGQFSSPGEEERFLREARAAAQLHHPGIVAVYDVGRDQETLYIVSELVQGVTLAEWLKGRGMSFLETAELVAQVADALDYAHRQGVVHRDVKPSNIMLALDGAPEQTGSTAKSAPVHGGNGAPRPEPPPNFGGQRAVCRPRVLDFGLALRDAGEATLTLDGQVLGTPAYMSPEQVCNPHAVDGRSDVYSLGVVLYEMLTGEIPFRSVTRMRLLQVVHEAPRPPRRLNDRVPPDLETICLKCLAKDPGRRYRTAAALAADLRRWRASEPILARPVGRVERLWLWAKRKPAVAVTGAVAAVALLAISGAPSAAAFMAVTTGALLFALHKANAAAELAQAVEDLSQNQRKSAAALQFALKQYHLAREERDRLVAAETQANRRFGQVRKLARKLIFDLSHEMENLVRPAPAQALLKPVLGYLDGLAKEVGDDPLLVRELAVTYAKVGDVQRDQNQANPGDAAGALASYRKSREIFASLAKAHPNNAQAQRDLAVSQRMVSDLLGIFGQASIDP